VKLRISFALTVVLVAVSSCSQQAATSPSGSVAPSASAVQGTTEEATEAPPGAIVVTVGHARSRFDPDQITAPAGTLTFFIDHVGTEAEGSESHQMSIGLEVGQLPLVASDIIKPGHSAVFTVTGLGPGSYFYWCYVNSHYAEGMVGTLTVTP
jgi:plastocyanin